MQATGVETDGRGFVKTNDRLETSVPGVYRLGDIKGGPAFTHVSYDDFRVNRSNLLEGGSASIRNRFVPYTVFIDPQLGRAGMTEAEAQLKGLSIKIAKMPISHVVRALKIDETRGFTKAIIEVPTQQILGAQCWASKAGS